MRVVGYAADDSGCGAYRIVYPLAAAAAVEDVATELRDPMFPQWKSLSGEVPQKVDAGDADVVILHRPLFGALVDNIAPLQAEGRAVVVDVDDDLQHPHPQHPWASLGSRHLDPRQCLRACELADLVTVSSDALAQVYGRHGRVRVLRNGVPEHLLEMPRRSSGKTIGWGGIVHTHPEDLLCCGAAVGDLVESDGWRFLVVGSPKDVQVQLDLPDAPDFTGGLTVSGYQDALGQLDLGIVPLGDTLFNHSKSWLKGLEYAARGVPFVAADVPEYRLLAAKGAGVVAASPREWFAHLRDLMRDESLRSDSAERGRAAALGLTYETRAHEWSDAWAEAIANRRDI